MPLDDLRQVAVEMEAVVAPVTSGNAIASTAGDRSALSAIVSVVVEMLRPAKKLRLPDPVLCGDCGSISWS